MARDLGGRGQSADRKDDWQRIESEQSDRDRVRKQYDATHDPGLLFELQARKPPEYPHREGRKCPPEVAAKFDRTPEQIEALKEAERARQEARAAKAEANWTNEMVRDRADGRHSGGLDGARESKENQERRPDDRGTLIMMEGRRVLEVPLTQTDNGPVQRAGGRDALGIPAGSPVDTHLEAHAAAFMRARGTRYAELYVSREPCPGRSGCASLLPTMLAPGSALFVRSEDGTSSGLYVGQAEGEGK